MMMSQLALPLADNAEPPLHSDLAGHEKLQALLSHDLDFHDQDSSYASHNFHAFPAKFPPQLPRLFIQMLTEPGDVVLDPMSGSGTTVLEACLANRQAVGFDIDPLALLLTTVKTTPLDPAQAKKVGYSLLQRAGAAIVQEPDALQAWQAGRWDEKTTAFMTHWFKEESQLELAALLQEIEQVPEAALQSFFKLAFSSIIITKSGGVSLARDLAHTRPHKAKVVYDAAGNLLLGAEFVEANVPRLAYVSKILRSPLEEFEKRLRKNLESIGELPIGHYPPAIQAGNAQALPLPADSVDLIVTSPPYASNAIDYMRAHKFSLAWFGHSIDELGERRRAYIGGEATTDFDFEPLPAYTQTVVEAIRQLEERKGAVLHRYYSEMRRTLAEMYRVLKPGKTAVLVVGNSIMRGKDTETAVCLADIGKAIGFNVPKIGVRELDRNRRMMPAGHQVNRNSQIQQRMHEEYVIGFIKPVVEMERRHDFAYNLSPLF